jgi:hypothetical protein
MRRFIPERLRCPQITVTLHEIIETGGNKTDANAVWLVTDQRRADLVRKIKSALAV